jgi:hypothetical protein
MVKSTAIAMTDGRTSGVAVRIDAVESLARALEGETLLVIDIVNAYGVILLQTVWATTADARAGHRRTDIERIGDAATLQHRLRDLVARIYGPITLTTAAA